MKTMTAAIVLLWLFLDAAFLTAVTLPVATTGTVVGEMVESPLPLPKVVEPEVIEGKRVVHVTTDAAGKLVFQYLLMSEDGLLVGVPVGDIIFKVHGADPGGE